MVLPQAGWGVIDSSMTEEVVTFITSTPPNVAISASWIHSPAGKGPDCEIVKTTLPDGSTVETKGVSKGVSAI